MLSPGKAAVGLRGEVTLRCPGGSSKSGPSSVAGRAPSWASAHQRSRGDSPSGSRSVAEMPASKAGQLLGERPRGLIGMLPLKRVSYMKQTSRPDTGLHSLYIYM